MQKLPAYYYQSTILTVDDDKLFSQALTKILSREFTVKAFNQPELLIEYINQYRAPLSNHFVLRDCSEHDEYDTASHALVDLDVPALHTLQKNPERNQEVSIVIVDFHMPNMTGLDVCRQINDSSAKKILLTGASDQQIAIDAFNNNLIDKFIRKDSPSIAEDIMSYVRTLAKQFYIDQTKSILTHLEASKPSPLTDEKFVHFFQQWCKENDIREFTLIDKSGTFCVTNKDGFESYFILHTDQSLDAFIQINDDVEEAAPFLEAMKSRKIIPFFGIGVDSWMIEPSEWSKYCHPAKVISGREYYYWSAAANLE